MYMWSLFPWPYRTIGASLHCLSEQTLPSHFQLLRFKQCCFRVVPLVMERRHHRIFLLGRRWVILDWFVVMQIFQNKIATYHKNQANTYLPHIVPRSLIAGKEERILGKCDTQNLCSNSPYLEFSPALQINRVDKDYMCRKIRIQHEFDMQGSAFTFLTNLTVG